MLKRQFNGSRLKEGRIYRGHTITELAEHLGVSKQMISKYENGKAIPTFEALVGIVNLLEFPRDYFYEEPVEVKTGNTYFRSLLSTGKKDREMQRDRVKYLSILRAMLEEYVDFPELDLPAIPDEHENDIEFAAKRVRDAWGLGTRPIKNLVYLMETKGFVLSSLKLDQKSIDAFGMQSEINGKIFYTIVLGNDKNSFYRRQFSLAHELAHIILHDPFLNLEDLNKEEFKQLENEANEFAAAFLLPKEEFIRDVSIHPTDLEYYKVLKKKWNVSIGMMVMRAYKLGIISQGSYQYMQRSISKYGWRKQEPFDTIKEMAEPVSIRQAVELLIENDYVTGEELISKLSTEYGLTLFRTDIEELLAVDSGYLKSKVEAIPNNIVSLKDRLDKEQKLN